MSGLLGDYSRQAETYDTTRSASPSVLAPLRLALEGAPGRGLLDVGGGTGNYALALRYEGWDPLVLDRSAAMLERARAKGLRTLEADAQSLPLPDGAADAAIAVHMLHHVDDQPRALAELRRVLRPGGRLAIVFYAHEDLESLWLSDYFPSTREWMRRSHPPVADVLAHLPGARRLRVVFEDLQDASLVALAGRPELLLEDRWRRQTSYFERMERDHPDELRAGLDRLRADIEAGHPPRGRGEATVLAWTKAAG
ncbi:MAG: hypothetical protein QOF17_263 [Solirubrobacteraceae bacterium]|jgi:demethylmenaquinone methyltransferase/2-methoxy-6-polyprenyl-1,4-benzoquinol methylase|nr:hypothetical protein [Solirubrobacteraceae bacterium]